MYTGIKKWQNLVHISHTTDRLGDHTQSLGKKEQLSDKDHFSVYFLSPIFVPGILAPGLPVVFDQPVVPSHDELIACWCSLITRLLTTRSSATDGRLGALPNPPRFCKL